MPKILIVDDDELLDLEVSEALRAEGHWVDAAKSNLDAKVYLCAAGYDLVILDWELPDGSGTDICKEIRSSATAHVPILFLTARSAITDKQTGFNSGADDYLTKPFHMIELVARVKALLKRPPVIQSRQLTVRNIMLDMDKHEVFVAGQKIELYPREFRLLEFLMSNPNQLYSSDDLLRRVWPTDSDSTGETIRVTIMRLRQKLVTGDDRPLIVTLRNIGYRLEP